MHRQPLTREWSWIVEIRLYGMKLKGMVPFNGPDGALCDPKKQTTDFLNGIPHVTRNIPLQFQILRRQSPATSMIPPKAISLTGQARGQVLMEWKLPVCTVTVCLFGGIAKVKMFP